MSNNRLENLPVVADATSTSALFNNSSLSNESDNTAYLAAQGAASSNASEVLPQLEILFSGNQGNVTIAETQADNGSNSANGGGAAGDTQITISGNNGSISINEAGGDTAGNGDQQIDISGNNGTIDINEGNCPPPVLEAPPPVQPVATDQPANPSGGGGDQPSNPSGGVGDQPSSPSGGGGEQASNPSGGGGEQPSNSGGSGTDSSPVQNSGSGQPSNEAPTASQVASLYSQIGTSDNVAAHFEGLADIDTMWPNTKDQKFQSRRESVYLNNASLQWASMSNMFGGGTVQTPDVQQSTPADQVTYDQQQMTIYQQQFLADEKAYTQGGSTGNQQLEQQLANDAATLSSLDSDEVLNLPDNYYNHNAAQEYTTPEALGLPANTQSY